MKKQILFTLLFLFICNSSFAKRLPPSPLIRPPVVILPNPAKLKPITLSEMTIDSEIISNIATSTYELVFYNPNNRVLEGELVFSLFDGQNIIDYALQINGKYRHASVIPKAIAKQAYEETIRARIDPSVIEKTIGNNFKTRLYPIPAKGYKRIKITLQETLKSRKNKLQYRIPFVTKTPLKKLNISVNLPSLTSRPEANYPGLKFDKVTQGQSIRLQKNNAQVKQPITIQIANPTKESVFVQKAGKGSYVFSSLAYKKPAKSYRAAPKSIAILWNTSFSNRQRNISKELQFLNGVIQKAGSLQVQLITFSNQSAVKNLGLICAQNVKCPRGRPFSFLRNALQKLNYDGTTNYNKIVLNQLKAEEVLLFSNGIKTIFNADLKKINKPITAINSATGSDTGVLKSIANKSNGRFIDISNLTVNEGIQKFLSNTVHIKVLGTSSNINKGDVFTEFQNNRITVFARTKNQSNGWIQLEINHQGQLVRKAVKLGNPVYIKHHLNSLWAARKIENLSLDYKRNKKSIINLAKHYKILTKDMSLIVLDRVEDYVRYEILPPNELRKKYYALLKQKQNKKLYEKEQALISSIKLLQEQKVWYRKAFPKNKPKPVAPQKPVANRRENREANNETNSETAPSVAAPAPVMAAPRRMAKKVSGEAKRSVPPRKAKAEIKLAAFSPNAPYIKAIKAQKKANWLKAYRQQKAKHAKQPMFYVDVADIFYKNNLKTESIKILSNLLEMDFENSEFLRVYALKAMELGQYHLAIKAFEKVKQLRPFEPQSFRDLALAYGKAGQNQKAADLLYHILIHTWDNRFSGIKIVVINELNNILMKHKNVNKRQYDKRLITQMPVDLRIVINWSSDNTDIDLWVVDPYKEKTFYSNKVSRIGGKISNDITQGYGPEEFMIKDAVMGSYKIQANYYGNTQQKALIPVTIRAEIYSNYGKPNEEQKEIVLRLKNQKAVIDIGKYLYRR